MKSFTRLVLVILLAGFSLSAQTLNEQQWQKLHPAFQSIVSESAPVGLLKSSAGGRPATGYEKNGVATYDAIIYTSNLDVVRGAGVHVNSSWPGFVTAQLTKNDLLKLAALAPVSYLDPGSVNSVQTDVSVPEIGVTLLHQGFVNATPYRGLGAIVLIYDTGIDWKHIDFRSLADWTKTRILYIWDQTITTPISGENPPFGFSYGVEYTKAQIDDENDGTPTNVVREADINGHGTHVSGTAAGSGLALNKYVGVAPQADIIVVKGGDGSFSEARMIDGLTYAQNKANALGKPIVVNWSIGGQSGPHDGSRAYELAVNSFVSTPGRVVCIAAGNDGANLIHFGGSISTGGSSTVRVTVPTPYTPNSGSNNDRFSVEIWFNNNATVTSAVTFNGSPPGSTNGAVTLSNTTSSLNSNRTVSLDVSDASGTPPASGTWTVTLSNPSISTTYDAWMVFKTMGATMIGADNNRSISMPATAQGAITVGAYVTKWTWPTYLLGPAFGYTGTDRTGNIATFSGIGPTADGRQKPDIAAPGQGIVSALSTMTDTTGDAGSIAPGQKHWTLAGTSMATPHMAGVSALLLGVNPALTAVAIKNLLTSTATTDGFTGAVPGFTWGYGKVNAFKAMAKSLNASATADRVTLSYDVSGTNQIVTMTSSTKLAVKFTPTMSGRLVGVLLNITTPNNNPIQGAGPLHVAVYSNTTGSTAGIPGTQIGSTVIHPYAQLNMATSNYINLLGANVTVTASVDYHVVLSNANTTDVLLIRTDDGLGPTNRSSIFANGQWYNFSDANSGQPTGIQPANLRLRAVVASVSGTSSVEQLSEIPRSFELKQNFPNPFNPSTKIRYSVSERGRVQLRVFDVLGRHVATLVDDTQSPGTYEALWDAGNGLLPIASGVYFYRLEQGTHSSSQKMLLLK